MEKSTVKFMEELWSLLGVQQNASGVPPQFLNEKEAEIFFFQILSFFVLEKLNFDKVKVQCFY